MRTTVHTLLEVVAGQRPPVRRALALLASTALVVTLWPAVAQADPTLTTTSTVTAKATPGESTALEGLSVNDSNADDILQVTLSTDVGTLSMDADPAGLTLAFGNTWAGDSSITFDGLPADVNSALGSVELQPGANAGQIAHVSIAALVSQPGYVYSPANEHFYEYVPAYGISWNSAFAAAGLRTYEGQQGYLATIPNDTVNDLVSSKIDGAANVWFGADALQTPGEPIARTWKWTAGPLAGYVVTKCTTWMGDCDFVDNQGLYSHWAWGEPNNNYGWEEEDAPVTNWGGGIGWWNDLPKNNSSANSSISGYLVEYGDLPQGDSSFEGVATDTSSVSIEGPPLAPTNLDAQHGNGQATLTFEADGNGSPITGYETSVSVGDEPWVTTCPTSPCTVSELANGETYEIRIRAINANGPGPYSGSVQVTPSTTREFPPEPRPSRVTTAQLSPSMPLSPTVAPRSRATPSLHSQADATAPCLGSPCLVDGLDNGTAYTFTVHATNINGSSDESDPTAAVSPAGVPAAPRPTSLPCTGTARRRCPSTLRAPNGSPITGYLVTTGPDGSTTSCDGSPCDISGLNNGTAYTFTVQAVNEVGTGDESGPSQPVTPATLPDAPGALSAVRGDERIELSFGAPIFNGSSQVTGYEYSLDGGGSWSALDTSATEPVTATVLELSQRH